MTVLSPTRQPFLSHVARMSRAALAATLLLLSPFALPPAPAQAAPPAAVLGVEGEIYRLHRGTYGHLFPSGDETAAGNVVLALDVVRGTEAVQRILVPGTEGPEEEQTPSLSLANSVDGVFLVWEARQSIHSGLYLRRFDGEAWGELIEFSGNPFSDKSNPHLATTSERYVLTGTDGIDVTFEQRILHLVWWDEAAASRSVYAPIVLGEDGEVYRGPVFELSGFLPPTLPPSSAPPRPALLRALRVQPGADRESANVVFTDPDLGRVAVLELRLTAGGVAALADEARAQVIIVGSQAAGRTAAELAAAVREHLVQLPGLPVPAHVLTFIADQLAAELAAENWNDQPIESLADEARAQVINVGSSLRGGVQSAVAEARAQVIIVGSEAAAEEHAVTVRLLAHHEPPPAPGDTPLQVLSSADGQGLIVAWDRNGSVKYREKSASGWSDTRTLVLGEHLSRDEAYQLLEKRLATQ